MSDPNFKPHQLSAESLEGLLRSAFSADSDVVVRDMTGNGYHFDVMVISVDFEGLNSVKRHQKVYSILKDEWAAKLHALTLKTATPSEWKKGNS